MKSVDHLTEGPLDTSSPACPGETRNAGGENIAKKIFLSSGKVFFFQAVGLLLSFGFQAFLSRTCGAGGLGGYTLFVSWLGILSVLTVPGLESTLVYFLPRYENDSRCRRQAVQACVLIVGAISTFLAFVLVAAGDKPLIWVGLPSKARLSFAFSIILFSLGKLLDSAFLGMRNA